MKSNQRNSSVELFRILSIFFVILVHWNGWFVGGISTPEDITSDPSCKRVCQLFLQVSWAPCVNMFLLISGFFGIRLKFASVLKIYVLLLSIFIPYYVVGSLFWGTGMITWGGVLSYFLCFTRSGYFVQCYLMLMVFSPVLNSFCESKGSGIIPWVIGFCILEFYFGYIQEVDNFGYADGYSVIHFIMMYMVGRCLWFAKDYLGVVKKRIWIGGYFACSVFVAGVYLGGGKNAISYINPLIILSTICLFMPFAFNTFYSRTVNRIASSSLAVYIGHVFWPMGGILRSYDNMLLQNYSYPIYWLLSLLIILFVVMGIIVYDNLRKIITNPVEDYINEKYCRLKEKLLVRFLQKSDRCIL